MGTDVDYSEKERIQYTDEKLGRAPYVIKI